MRLVIRFELTRRHSGTCWSYSDLNAHVRVFVAFKSRALTLRCDRKPDYKTDLNILCMVCVQCTPGADITNHILVVQLIFTLGHRLNFTPIEAAATMSLPNEIQPKYHDSESICLSHHAERIRVFTFTPTKTVTNTPLSRQVTTNVC